ncbi:hypothetical protein ACFVAV_22565 [Nocardia sp. NPDC057663]|uniref:hypothetical protein n=1 Tax=Nocardia sp. NPDC057663 TaxID=3346201 RepID=UPI00366B0272
MTVLNATIQVVGGIAVGWSAGMFALPRTAKRLRQALGLTDNADLFASIAYWSIVGAMFAALAAAAITLTVNRNTRWFGAAAVASLTLAGLMLSAFLVVFST